MLTQAAPAIIQSLTGSLPPAVVQQLTQALANCSQPLTHRGPINFSPKEPNQSGPGYVTGGRWNPQSPDLSELLGKIFDILGTQVDTAGWGGPGGVNNYNYQGDTFNMPINWNPSTNEYYGGPNIYNGGDTYNNNSYSNTINTTTVNAGDINTTNINTTTINNFPAPGGGGGPWGGVPVGFPFPVPAAPQPRQRLNLQPGQIGPFLKGKAQYDRAQASTASITYVTDVFCNNDGTIGKSTASATVVTGISQTPTNVSGITEGTDTAIVSGTLI